MPKFCENNLPECIENRNNVHDIMSRIKNVNKLLDSVDFKIDSMKEELDFSQSDYSELQILGTQLKPEIFKLEDSTEIDLNNSIDLKAILKLDLSGLENEEESTITHFKNTKITKNKSNLKHKAIKTKTGSSIKKRKPISNINLKTNHIEKSAIEKSEPITESNSSIDTSTYRVNQSGGIQTELNETKTHKTNSKPALRSPQKKSTVQKSIKFGEVKKAVIPKPKIDFILRNKRAVQRSNVNRLRSKSEPRLNIEAPKKPKQFKTKPPMSRYSNTNKYKTPQKKYLEARPSTASKISSLKKPAYRHPSLSARDGTDKLRKSPKLQERKVTKTMLTKKENFESKAINLKTRDELAKGDESKAKAEPLPEKQFKEEAVQTLESSMSVQLVSKAIETESFVTSSLGIQAEESDSSQDYVESQATFVRVDHVSTACSSTTSYSSFEVSDDESLYEVPSQFVVKSREVDVKALRKENCQTNRTNDSGFVDPSDNDVTTEDDAFYDAMFEALGEKTKIDLLTSFEGNLSKNFSTRKAIFNYKVVQSKDGCDVLETSVSKKFHTNAKNE